MPVLAFMFCLSALRVKPWLCYSSPCFVFLLFSGLAMTCKGV